MVSRLLGDLLHEAVGISEKRQRDRKVSMLRENLSSPPEPTSTKHDLHEFISGYIPPIKKATKKRPFLDQNSAPQDLRALNSGAKRRRSYSVTEKAEVLQLLQNAESDASVHNKHAKVEADTGVSQSLISKWGRDRNTIFRSAAEVKTANLLRCGTKTPGANRWWPLAEQQLYKEIVQRRSRNRRVAKRWIVVRMRALIRELHPGCDKPAFRASEGWKIRFCKRYNLVPRRKSNLKAKPILERLPALQHFHTVFRKMLSYSSSGKLLPIPAVSHYQSVSADTEHDRGVLHEDDLRDPKWGRFAPHQRFNVDQVPLPFVFHAGGADTYDTKGVARVRVAENGGGSMSKRQATAQLCFRPVKAIKKKDGSLLKLIQPKPAIIFRGQGKRVSTVEKLAWNPGVDVLWQHNAWVDRAIAPAWAGDCFAKFVDEADQQLKYAGLGDLAVDQGYGREHKRQCNRLQEDWLEDDDNLSRWEDNKLSVGDKRVLLTHWLTDSNSKVNQDCDLYRYHEKGGWMMTVNGWGDERITPEGRSGYSFDTVQATVGGWKSEDYIEVQKEVGDPPPNEAEPGVLSEQEDEGDLYDDEGAEADEATEVAWYIPDGFLVVESFVEQKNRVGQQILFHWQGSGWCQGVVKTLLTPAQQRKTGANFEVKYEDGDRANNLLVADTYAYGESAPYGSWVHLKKTHEPGR
ncbi:hypothetical protein CYMTET_41452 [Cymbomonas tetramitiformis]|uniref:HTH CENPB-type domain-containing protein n=1 Tax=Cymbomonas tetramitiformis TaxID=36881 RepID=A0AAE0C7F1_9CHLO|nr:hypothetical protein CYMTET_41452 [Cymbomonas tetramitiformis]